MLKEITYDDARKRNLEMKMFKVYLQNRNIFKAEFNLEEINSLFKFKQKDMESYIDNFFYYNTDEKLKINNHINEKMKSYLLQYDKYKSELDTSTVEYKRLYRILEDYFSSYAKDEKIYHENMKKIIEIASNLHYIYMPLYDETMIINRGCLPEDNIEEYYNHFHAIQDLYYEIVGKGKKWDTAEGDLNLGRDLEFRVYTARWGHEDTYIIQRTSSGWSVRAMAINGKSEKNGRGALTRNLEHDSVCYPKEGVEYAMETLWNEADTTDMTIKQLQVRLQEIADWISEVERVTHKYQPSWCLYY